MALVVDVWVFMVLPTVFALTKSILPISQGELPIDMPHHRPLAGCLTPQIAAEAIACVHSARLCSIMLLKAAHLMGHRQAEKPCEQHYLASFSLPRGVAQGSMWWQRRS